MIQPTPGGASQDFIISSSPNPFAPSFANLTMSLEDANTSTERYTFNFSMNNTIIPDASITPDHRVAKCIFEGTMFWGTLWTRQHNGAEITEPSQGGVNFGSWPGDVEVVQEMDATLGEPKCFDFSGNPIADVQAGQGTCECQYASLDTGN